MKQCGLQGPIIKREELENNEEEDTNYLLIEF